MEATPRATGIWPVRLPAYLRRQLRYKAGWRGCQVMIADRWYPSSKLCSCCGHLLAALGVGMRDWTCPGCAVTHDRDVNAAVASYVSQVK